MLKKEEIYVKLTRKNVYKVVSILKDINIDRIFSLPKESLKRGIYEYLYLYYDQIPNCYEWLISPYEPNKNRKRIKPKKLKELLDNKPPYSSKYWDNPLWEVTKGGIGDKGLEYKPKTLEIGKWYKYQGFDHIGNDIRIMFLFNGIKGNEEKMIGFDNNGEYCNNISIYYASAEILQETTPEEVIEAFIYHFEKFG